jgi:hypothetical protein
VFLKSTIFKKVFALLLPIIFFFILAALTNKPVNAAAFNINPPLVSGTGSNATVIFNWDVPTTSSNFLVISDEDDPAKTIVWDSGVKGVSINGLKTITVSTSSWIVGQGIAIDGNFKVTILDVVFGGSIVSNQPIFIIPSTPPPGGSWTLNTPKISGTDITFTWDPAANIWMSLVIVDEDDPAKTVVWDSGVKGVSINGLKTVTVSTSTWDHGQGITIDGNFSARLWVGNVAESLPVIFNMESGNGKNWNDPGAPPPPFNIMDVFQPAKRFGSFGQLASDILLILVSLAGALALIFIMVSGFKFVTSSGDEKKLASARATLTYAIIGIAVVILAFVIVQILQYFLQSSIPIT